MRIIMAVTLIVVISLSAWFLSGCGSKGGLFGQPITESNVTRIGDILAHPEQFDKKTVLIEGKIVEECPAGGWFMLKDEAGIIYVDLHPSYFAIPQAVGHHTMAQGVVREEDSRVSVIGKGVQLK